MRYLGSALARTGVSVRGMLLPGHGTSFEDLERVRWQDWAAAVDREVDEMSRRCRRVAVVGLSLGGLLALHTAARRPGLAAVASLAAPLWLRGLSRHAARLITGPLGGWIRKLPKLAGSDVRDRRASLANPSYRAIPTRALKELLSFMRVAEAALPQIAPPVLVVHARRDHTAPVACADRIAELTTSARARRVRILPRSFHVITIDVERDVVAQEVIDFLRMHARGPLHPEDSSCAM